MAILIGQLVVDAADPLTLARWWSQVLGWSVEEDDEDEVWLAPPPGGGIGTDHPGLGGLPYGRAPTAKRGKNGRPRARRPPHGSSQDAELERLLELGATRVDIGQGDVTWHVLADPEGNEFCLLRSTPARLAQILAEQEDDEPPA